MTHDNPPPTTPDGLPWRKSSFSSANGECVEVAATRSQILVRDSNNPNGARLTGTNEAWTGFLAGVQAGEFDLS